MCKESILGQHYHPAIITLAMSCMHRSLKMYMEEGPSTTSCYSNGYQGTNLVVHEPHLSMPPHKNSNNCVYSLGRQPTGGGEDMDSFLGVKYGVDSKP